MRNDGATHNFIYVLPGKPILFNETVERRCDHFKVGVIRVKRSRTGKNGIRTPPITATRRRDLLISCSLASPSLQGEICHQLVHLGRRDYSAAANASEPARSFDLK